MYPFFGSVLFVLFWGILYFFWGEKISVNNGCGYDGTFYCNITQNFDLFIQNKAFSVYYANRILPCGIVWFSLKILGLPLSLQNIITAFYVMNIVSWLIFLFFWNKILHYYQISKSVQWLMSVLILISFYFMKFIFYYPVLTDGIALLSGTLLLWFYIQNKFIAILITAFLGSFVYPLFAVYAGILIVFPVYFKLKPIKKQNKTFIDYLIITFLLMLFLLLRMYVVFRVDYSQSIGFHLNTLLYIITYSYVLYHILPSYACIKANKSHILAYFLHTKTLQRIAIASSLFLLTTGIKFYISQNPVLENPKSIYLIKSLAGIGFHGATWITEFFSGFGLIAVLFIILLKKVYQTSTEQGLGFYLVVLSFCLLNFQKETRITMDIYTYILLAIALSMELYTTSLKKYHIFIFALINVLLSKWYLPVEKSPLIFNHAEHTWIYQNYALSTYLMNNTQYAGLLVIFLLLSAMLFRVFK